MRAASLRDPGWRFGTQVRRPRLCRLRRGSRGTGKDLGFIFDYIIVCVVTGSTQGGMIVGFAALDRADRVIGIDASGTLQQTRDQVRKIVDATSELVNLGRSVREDEIVINLTTPIPLWSALGGDQRGDPARGAHRGDDYRPSL
ncbi:hypothetical protein DXU02_34930 [Rhizobium leguminosarum]